jgi:hypothetical protein
MVASRRRCVREAAHELRDPGVGYFAAYAFDGIAIRSGGLAGADADHACADLQRAARILRACNTSRPASATTSARTRAPDHDPRRRRSDAWTDRPRARRMWLASIAVTTVRGRVRGITEILRPPGVTKRYHDQALKPAAMTVARTTLLHSRLRHHPREVRQDHETEHAAGG